MHINMYVHYSLFTTSVFTDLDAWEDASLRAFDTAANCLRISSNSLLLRGEFTALSASSIATASRPAAVSRETSAYAA